MNPEAPNPFESPSMFDNIDNLTDPEVLQGIILAIGDEEGELAQRADGDLNHLRFLREDAVATLDALINPDNEEVRERQKDARSALHAYEKHKSEHL